MWHGAQLTVDTTLVSPLTSDAQPRRRGGQYAGAALHTARRNKERTYPELVGAGRCRLVVLAIEVGVRWSTEATQFLRLLAQARARATPAPLRQATITTLIARWSALLTHASMHAFAASLLNTRDTNCNNGDGALPPLGHLLAQTPVGTATPSRLPGRWPHRFGLFWTLDFPLWWTEHIWRLASIKTVSQPQRVWGTMNSCSKKVRAKKKMRQILTKHAIRNKFRVRDIQSAFRRYANTIVLENRHFEGERGLEMIAHQKPRLVEFFRKNRSVKLNIRTEAFFEKPEYDDGGNDIGSQELVYALPSTRFNISNEDETDTSSRRQC